MNGNPAPDAATTDTIPTTGNHSKAQAYWNCNIAPSQWTKECPAYLANKNEHDQRILRTPDAEYTILTWDDVKEYVRNNWLDRFQRVPSDLRRYFAFNYLTTQQYGSVMTYILTQKLHWPTNTLTPKGRPFEFPEDLAIKWNDWPYGIDERVVHLVVWTKFRLEEDPDTGDLSVGARREVQGWVDQMFGRKCGLGNVVWFRNWAALQSVRAVPHFHVMMYDPPEDFIAEITRGDVPYFKRVKKGSAEVL